MNKVKLVNETFEVDEDIASKSQLIKNMIDDKGTKEEIPLN